LNEYDPDREASEAVEKVEKYLRVLRKRFIADLRRPKFFIEVAGLFVLIIYALYTVRMYHANRDSADAAAKSATTGRDALTISERPWVSIDVQPNSDIGFSESGMFMYDILAINNRGVTPAVNARAEIQIVGSGVEEAVQKMCSGLEVDSAKTQKPYLREAYFTGVPTYKSWILTFDQMKEGHSREHNGTFEPTVIACVAYQSSFDPHVWHHTWKAYAVIKRDAQSFNGTYVMEDGKAVKKADVILAPWVRPEGED
jgi:hypothetical protein